jgi:hypothetical protein
MFPARDFARSLCRLPTGPLKRSSPRAWRMICQPPLMPRSAMIAATIMSAQPRGAGLGQTRPAGARRVGSGRPSAPTSCSRRTRRAAVGGQDPGGRQRAAARALEGEPLN